MKKKKKIKMDKNHVDCQNKNNGNTGNKKNPTLCLYPKPPLACAKSLQFSKRGMGRGVEPLFFHVNTLPLSPASLLYSLTQTPTAEVTMLISTNFDNFAITYLIEVACFKFHFPIELVLNSFQTQKGLEPDFRL